MSAARLRLQPLTSTCALLERRARQQPWPCSSNPRGGKAAASNRLLDLPDIQCNRVQQIGGFLSDVAQQLHLTTILGGTKHKSWKRTKDPVDVAPLRLAYFATWSAIGVDQAVKQAATT